MAKKPRREDDDTAALYVRLPRRHAEKLDRLAFEHRRPKRDIIEMLVADHLPEAGPLFVRPLSSEATVGHAEVLPAQGTDVLTPAQAAVLLQTAEETVLELARAGELPGRQVGGEWRFLRAAVLGWLAG
jgi:excisionase family DNA binding protein